MPPPRRQRKVVVKISAKTLRNRRRRQARKSRNVNSSNVVTVYKSPKQNRAPSGETVVRMPQVKALVPYRPKANFNSVDSLIAKENYNAGMFLKSLLNPSIEPARRFPDGGRLPSCLLKNVARISSQMVNTGTLFCTQISPTIKNITPAGGFIVPWVTRLSSDTSAPVTYNTVANPSDAFLLTNAKSYRYTALSAILTPTGPLTGGEIFFGVFPDGSLLADNIGLGNFNLVTATLANSPYMTLASSIGRDALNSSIEIAWTPTAIIGSKDGSPDNISGLEYREPNESHLDDQCIIIFGRNLPLGFACTVTISYHIEYVPETTLPLINNAMIVSGSQAAFARACDVCLNSTVDQSNLVIERQEERAVDRFINEMGRYVDDADKLIQFGKRVYDNSSFSGFFSSHEWMLYKHLLVSLRIPITKTLSNFLRSKTLSGPLGVVRFLVSSWFLENHVNATIEDMECGFEEFYSPVFEVLQSVEPPVAPFVLRRSL